ncbi:hypothetical protein GCM10010106_17790 [Thermopolyspora flexuosa]|uniref:hypothetical protein n=1 Tax=Thermopolyspora flexuosa TaxID=103836 RepID=UPI00115193D6|nr:hypothetical protein [Thermopolyspora flexuosa]GGM71925.1 hypothetical protein GCM10010106_17790 [Thermopolyspora flexuosa]
MPGIRGDASPDPASPGSPASAGRPVLATPRAGDGPPTVGNQFKFVFICANGAKEAIATSIGHNNTDRQKTENSRTAKKSKRDPLTAMRAAVFMDVQRGMVDRTREFLSGRFSRQPIPIASSRSFGTARQ